MSDNPPPKARAPEIKRLIRNLDAEREGAAIYYALARAERNEERRKLLVEMADQEAGHAALWESKLREMGAEPPPARVSLRVRVLGWVASTFGVSNVLPSVIAFEDTNADVYAIQSDAQRMAREERNHAMVFTQMSKALAGPEIAGRERWHRTDSGGSLRAMVFGVNDGLVSNMSLVMGVAGGVTVSDASGHFVLLAGVAGLLAGAFSMGAGEYISIRSQRELFERQVALEREELEFSPEDEQAELSMIYRAKGVPKEEAERLASTIIADPNVALDTLVREELGFDQEALGSPWGAAISSFVAFAIGAIAPVLPWMFSGGFNAVLLSAIFGVVALFLVGAALSIFTGRHPVYSGARMLLIGSLAAIATFGIGRLLGVSVAG